VDRLDDSPRVTVRPSRAADATELTVHVELPASLPDDGVWSHARDGWRDAVDRLVAELAARSVT
jgi:hypothetical protein